MRALRDAAEENDRLPREMGIWLLDSSPPADYRVPGPPDLQGQSHVPVRLQGPAEDTSVQ